MKLLIGAVVVILVGTGAWWGLQGLVTQDAYSISMAFGFPKEDTIEMQAIATMAMSVTEPPRADPETGKPLWEEWVDQHFDLRDAGGNRVALGLRQTSDMIPKNKVVGTPEGFLRAQLKTGQTYTFDYIPKRLETKRFRCVFTVPSADSPVERVVMSPA